LLTARVSFEQALGQAIGTQVSILEEIENGKTVTIGRDGTTLKLKSPS
jgi:hypothetical protein